MLHDIFLASKLTTDSKVVQDYFNEIVTGYSSSKRYYHNLSHLENLFIVLTSIQEQITDWDTLMFSVFYHDIVYDISKQNNEAESAMLARQRLESLHFPQDKIACCEAQILATKHHSIDKNMDTNFFLDADLCILGSEPNLYAQYKMNIRKEYAIYSELIYNAGRRKVLNHFLSMEKIYKTKAFYDRFEDQARRNLMEEHKHLQ